MLSFDFQFQRGAFELQAKATLGAGVTGICGPSGSGKSTLLALLAGLLRPTRGTMQIDGEALVDTGKRLFIPPWQRHIGIVFQDGQLFPHLSVRKNLLYGYSRLAPHARQFHLAGVLELLEIGHLLERRPALLSGGERQRVALGRALLYSPRVLLLDEPLASLDERLKQQILPFFQRIQQQTKVPMLYVSHAPAELAYLTERVLVMESGRLQDGELQGSPS